MWPVAGHQHAVELLRNSIIQEHVAHAYLFTGPPHVGKSTLARAFAQALNCDQQGDPCGQCRACRLIERDRHHDVQVIRVDGDVDGGLEEHEGGKPTKKSSASIGIERVRALQHDAALAPYEARRKVYVVLEAERMTVDAANCLLKTLEEPPQRVVWILTTVDVGLLLPTVVSRCQQVALSPLPLTLVSKALVDRWGAGEEEAERLARLSRGCIGWAVNALTNPKVLSNRSAQLERMIAVVGGSRVQRFKLAERLAVEFSGNQLGLLGALGLWLEWWRDLLLFKTGCGDMVANADHIDGIRVMAEQLSIDHIYSYAREIEATMRHLDANANVRLALEALMLAMPSADAVGVDRR